ncbi:MAG: sulfite exporter TauE/SafE family protein [Desulfobacteraceae bacterium]|nr:MAG: sulfite exporter TauE/SafE family protein [Desulfobacteraceae bacterium]
MNFLIGFLAGLFGGLVGIGGGVVMIPMMVGIKKLSQHQAHGTSLVVLVFTGITGAVIYYATKGAVDFVAAGLLATTAILTAHKGAHLAHDLPEWKLKKIFGAFIIVISLLLVLKTYIPHVSDPLGGWAKVIILLSAGALTGLISGMMGVGGGSLMVPAMVLLVGMNQHLAQGSSLLAMIPAGAAGAWTHHKLGNVQTDLLYGLIPGVIGGAFLGSSIANYLPENILRVVFGVVIIWTGILFLRAPKKIS